VTVSILQGDCRDMLRTLPDGSVQCVVTSPPYFGLRDYGVDGQIGLEPTPAEFVAAMVDVFREVRRVLRDDGTLFLNLGDSYHSSGPRQTGRNDANRETPGGRGGSFRGGERRAIPYGTSGTEPEGYRASDCLCGNLCDVCRRAYRIGKSHSNTLRVPTLDASILASSLAHKEFVPAHLPTLGLMDPAGRSAAAILDPQQAAIREGAPLPDASLSTPSESCPPRPEDCLQLGQPSECRLCGCSLQGSAPVFARMAGCNCDTSQRESASGISGKDAASLAYRHLTTESLKPKDLIGIPWRVAFALQADGWYLRQDIIWAKPNPMPESVRDRCTKAHEYIFMMSKSARYFYDQEAIKEPMSMSSVERLTQPSIDTQPGSDRVPGKTNGNMKAVGKIDKQRGHRRRHAGFNDRWDAMEKAEQCSGMRNKRSVWTVATQPFTDVHFATFPPELIEPCIKAGCPVGGTVIDPFGGAGTTGLVADRLGRNAILIELNPAYAEMAERRITNDAPLFAEVS
jgi:DNA modification methylase